MSHLTPKGAGIRKALFRIPRSYGGIEFFH